MDSSGTFPSEMSLSASICIIFLLQFSSGQKIRDVDTETAIQNKIFKEYNRYRKPVVNITTNVPFGIVLSLFSIEKVDEKSQTFSSVIMVIYRWRDEYLSWNTSEYEMEYLRVPAEKIWVPSICNFNELDSRRCMSYESVKDNEAFIHHTGSIILYNTAKSTIQCKINLQKYPFDEQRCTFEFMAVISTIHQLEMYENDSFVDTSSAIYNGEWILVSTEKEIRSIQDENNKSVNYGVDFTIKIRRRPTMAILTLMVPIIILSVINVFCFVLPIEEGEKIGMSMAIFLTFAVFATLLSETMPSSADNTSWFSIFVTTQVILSAVTIILETIVLRIYNYDPRTDQYEKGDDISGYLLKTIKEEMKKRTPSVGSKDPIKIKAPSNGGIALRIENVFMVCTICINILSLSLLFANIL